MLQQISSLHVSLKMESCIPSKLACIFSAFWAETIIVWSNSWIMSAIVCCLALVLLNCCCNDLIFLFNFFSRAGLSASWCKLLSIVLGHYMSAGDTVVRGNMWHGLPNFLCKDLECHSYHCFVWRTCWVKLAVFLSLQGPFCDGGIIYSCRGKWLRHI